MSIEIREYIGSSMNITESTLTKRPVNLNENFNEIGPISKDSIIQFIEGIHVGPTRNYTWYTEQALESSVASWTKPYQRPLIMHHNEKDGKTIGRILNAEYVTRNTRSGTPALSFICNVPDKDGKEQILDGRLKTVSIGVIAHDVRCSICGDPIEFDEYGSTVCGHERGNEYEGETCYWMIYKMEAKELSYVIVPSDIYAHNTKTMKAEDYLKNSKTKKDFKEGVTINMSEANKNLQEGQVIDETVKDGEEVAKTEKPDSKEEPNKKEENKSKEKPESKKDENSNENSEDKTEKDKEETDPKDKEIEELKAKVESLEKEKQEAVNDLLKVKKELEDTVKKVEEITTDLTAKEAELTKEVELKEAVEKELSDVKLEMREAKENELNSLRRSLNKPALLKESLIARSDESIKDAICDLKEELEGISNLRNAQKPNDPTMITQKNEKTTRTNVKESNTVGNINVEEGLVDIFSNMFNRRFI